MVLKVQINLISLWEDSIADEEYCYSLFGLSCFLCFTRVHEAKDTLILDKATCTFYILACHFDHVQTSPGGFIFIGLSPPSSLLRHENLRNLNTPALRTYVLTHLQYVRSENDEFKVLRWNPNCAWLPSLTFSLDTLMYK